LPLVSFISFIAHDLSENRFPLFGIVRSQTNSASRKPLNCQRAGG
jgi:hypothetical protein